MMPLLSLIFSALFILFGTVVVQAFRLVPFILFHLLEYEKKQVLMGAKGKAQLQVFILLQWLKWRKTNEAKIKRSRKWIIWDHQHLQVKRGFIRNYFLNVGFKSYF